MGGSGLHQIDLVSQIPHEFRTAFMVNYMFSTDTSLYGPEFEGFGLFDSDGNIRTGGQMWKDVIHAMNVSH
jgi:hypothetical protein